jgi:electron transfer flavoprotein beta subunit
MPNIIVLAKQVFYTQDLRIDRTNKKLVTEGVARVISESDKNAIEEAVRLKEKLGGKITVLTMGPAQAKEALREAIAMGADEGYMLTGPEFENSDAHATAVALAAGIKKIGQFDTILCGETSEDQYSFQVGPRTAEILNLPQITTQSRSQSKTGRSSLREVLKTPMRQWSPSFQHSSRSRGKSTSRGFRHSWP